MKLHSDRMTRPGNPQIPMTIENTLLNRSPHVHTDCSLYQELVYEHITYVKKSKYDHLINLRSVPQDLSTTSRNQLAMIKSFNTKKAFIPFIKAVCILMVSIFGSIDSYANDNSFFTCNGSITGFWIYDQSTDQPVINILNGTEIELNQLPSNYYLAAEVNGDITSVSLFLDGQGQGCENEHPYTWPAGAQNGSSWNGGVGSYVFRAQAFNIDGCSSEICDDQTISFSIVNNSGGLSATCFSIAQNNGGNLYQFSTSGSSFQFIGDLNASPSEVETMSLNYDGSVIFAVNGDEFGTVDKNTGQFFGYGFSMGNMNNPTHGNENISDVDGLAINSNTGLLYAVERDHNDNDMMFVIDPATGNFVPNAFGAGIDYVKLTGSLRDVDDIAFNPVDQKIYGISTVSGASTNDVVVEINTASGALTVITTLNTCDIEGLTFDDAGNLYGSTGNDGNACNSSQKNKIFQIPYGPPTANVVELYDFASLGSDNDVEATTCLVSAPAPCVEDCTREVFATTGCSGSTNPYTIYLQTSGGPVRFDGSNQTWQECTDGSVRYFGTAVKTSGTSADASIQFDIRFSGRTGTPPSGSPKSNTCEGTDATGWEYFTETSGTITTPNHGTFAVSRQGEAFQMGNGANIQSSGFGASGWVSVVGGDGFYSAGFGDINVLLTPYCGDPCGTLTANGQTEFNICPGESIDLCAETDAPNPPFTYVEFKRFNQAQSNPYINPGTIIITCKEEVIWSRTRASV